MHRHIASGVMVAAIAMSLLLTMSTARAGENARKAELETIRRILALPVDEIDLARVKMTIDRMIDPTIDAEATLAQIDDMVAGIRSLLKPDATGPQKVSAIRMYLHTPGAWNDYQPYSYNVDDPLGRDIQHKLLSTYLSTRRGQCVSMPILFMLLGRRLGLEMTLTTAPNHYLVKYRLPSGDWVNIEATSGGHYARDIHQQREGNISDKAIATRIYLQPLTKREVVVEMFSTLMEHYNEHGLYEAVVPVAELLLEKAPRSISAILNIDGASNKQLVRDCAGKYTTLAEVPPRLRPHCEKLLRRDILYWNKALELGWRQRTKSEKDAYLRKIKEAHTSKR